MTIHRVAGSIASDVLTDAVACIAGGGTLIFPTDTVYGIGCAPENEEAIRAVFAAKLRPPGKPLAIHIARPQEAEACADGLSHAARIVIEKFWPGPVAIIVRRRAGRYAAAACNGDTISLRCPDDAVCLQLLSATGPLAATSANLSGEDAFTGENRDLTTLPSATMALIAGPTRRRRESTVLDCSLDFVRVIRAGALDVSDVRRSLAGVARIES